MDNENYEQIDRYLDAANYITLARMYLSDNVLLEKPLNEVDLKKRFIGHWGTCPSINYIYAHLNYLISRQKCKIQLIVGAGHGGNALLANLYLEGSLQSNMPFLEEDKNGLKMLLNLERNICNMRAEINPLYPGTIYDGGELGYSLAVAYGSIFDSKDAIAVCIIGDGEAETGTISASWDCIQFLHKNDGCVLPIINMNSYKMGGKSILSHKTDRAICDYYKGLGYETRIVKCDHKEMQAALNWAINEFKCCKNEKNKLNPLIILQSPKGWTAPQSEKIHIENTRLSHKVPITDFRQNGNLEYLEKWLLSYRPDRLFDKSGGFDKNIKSIIPDAQFRMGKISYAEKKIKYPELDSIALNNLDKDFNNISILNTYLSELILHNKDRFRIVSPDEIESNLLGDLKVYEENVMEILNENICQGWMQGYNLSGKKSLMISYEAFMPIVLSMISQYAKCLLQMQSIPWRTLCPSMNYLLTSVCWENTYSHQNPEFVGSLLLQGNKNVNVYYPIDANTLLVIMDKVLKSVGKINIITVAKQKLPQYLSLEQAKRIMEYGYCVWNFGRKKPNIILIAVGDYCLNEMFQVSKSMEKMFPNVSYRLISIIGFTKFTKDGKYQFDEQLKSLMEFDVPKIIFFHGYPLVINFLFDKIVCGNEIEILGYQNKSIGAMTTLEKMVANECSRFHILGLINKRLYRKKVIYEKQYSDNIKTIKMMFKEQNRLSES